MMTWRCLALLCVAAAAACGGGMVAHVQAAEARMVFAHYMLKLAPLYGDDVAGFTREIQLAQKYGIDAFALNTPFWTDAIQARADALYQAAEAQGFKLFFSADFNSFDGSLTVDQLRTMLTRYSPSAAQLTYNGKQFFSTFEGTSLPPSTWADQVLNPGGGDTVFFVPCFQVQSAPESQIASVIQQYDSVLDGLLAWDASAWPYVDGALSDSGDRAYLQACQDASKVYMASMSPWFFNPSEGVRGNYAGDALWRQHWESLIQSIQPPLVEILTWNDWIERTYVVSVSTDVNTPSDAAANNDVGFPHLAYLDLAGRYYIPWYKTGQQPAIDSASKEALYVFYYTQSSQGSSVPSASVLEDKVYVSVLLFQAADVVVTSGTQSQTFANLPAGLQSVSMAFSPGQQSAQVLRAGAQVLSVTGALSVSSSSSSSDFNVYSNFQLAS